MSEFEIGEYEQKVDFFYGQDLLKGFDLKLFLEYNYSKNRFYPYGEYNDLATKDYADGLFKSDIEFAEQEIQIAKWDLRHGSSYEGAIGYGKRASWTEYSLGIDYIQNGVLKYRVFHFKSSKTITDDK